EGDEDFVLEPVVGGAEGAFLELAQAEVLAVGQDADTMNRPPQRQRDDGVPGLVVRDGFVVDRVHLFSVLGALGRTNRRRIRVASATNPKRQRGATSPLADASGWSLSLRPDEKLWRGRALTRG